MSKSGERMSRRTAITAGGAAAVELALGGSSALAQRKRKREPEKKEEPKLPEQPEPQEKTEFPGEMESRRLDEYADFLKTQEHTLVRGTPQEVIRLLQGIPQVLSPERHTPEDRKRVYGPFGNFLAKADQKKLPVIPFRNNTKTLFYNLSRSGAQETLTSARLEYLKSSDVNTVPPASLKSGVDVVVRRFSSLGEYDRIPILPLTNKSDAELNATRATLVGLAYTHKEAQEREERETVFVSGIILSPKDRPSLARLSVDSYAKRDQIGVDAETRDAIAKRGLLFVPALGHEAVGILARSWSAIGAPLVNKEGEQVGLLSDSVVLSYQDKNETVSKLAFIVQGPDAIREAQNMAQ